MKKIIKLNILFFLLLTQACISIPKIQEGGYIDKINDASVQLKNGQKLKTAKKKELDKTTIILVRHAEKKKDSKDPALTKEGMNRAENLKDILSSVEVDHIFSTDYNRTQLTARPTASAKNLMVESYSPKQIKNFGKRLLEDYKGKTVLVVGHSNTTPKLLNFLMNEKVVAKIEESDYENIFVINVLTDDERKALLLKYQN